MPEQRKRGRGRPKFEPTVEQCNVARALVACGHGAHDIGIYYSIDEKTARRAFRKELAEGRAFFGARLTAGIAHKALGGNLTAIIFILKTQFGWRETNRTELTGKDGQPLSFSDLSDDAARELMDALRASLGIKASGAGLDQENAPDSHVDAPAGPTNGGTGQPG